MAYRCWRCEHRWSQLLSPSEGWDADGHHVQPHPPPYGCPACGHLYMTATAMPE